MRSKNFAFIKGVNKKLYSDLCDIEYYSYLNPRNAAQKCRIVLENIVDGLMEKNGIEADVDLGGKLRLLRNSTLQRPRPHNLPGVNARCYRHDGTILTSQMNAYVFLRRLGNAGSHSSPYPTDEQIINPIPDSENAFKALSVLYNMLKEVFANEIEGDIPKFNQGDIPIGEFFIDQVKTDTVDRKRTNCIKEYSAYKYVSDNIDAKIYGLIREYEIDDITEDNTLQFDRMLDVYGVMRNQMRSAGITLKKLNEPGIDYANYYVVYEYDSDMLPLRTIMKKNDFDIREKMMLCHEIAKKLMLFHDSEEHVYLRLLTFDCVMVREVKTKSEIMRYDPIIIKFDFAKIQQLQQPGVTLLEKIQAITNSDEKEAVERVRRYCINSDFNENIDWEKVDVGSLGVLFADICEGKITTKDPKKMLDEFINEGEIPFGMIDLIDSMINPDNNKRPALGQVVERTGDLLGEL